MYINKSLTFLEQVIVALADRRREHIPFRQSKLTHCLKDSIGGNCNTLLVANVWGEEAQLEETVSIFTEGTFFIIMSISLNDIYEPLVDITLKTSNKNLKKTARERKFKAIQV